MSADPVNKIEVNNNNPSFMQRASGAVTEALTGVVKAGKRTVRRLEDSATAGVNSPNHVFRNSTFVTHKFFSELVALVTRPANFIQRRAGYSPGRAVETSPENLKKYANGETFQKIDTPSIFDRDGNLESGGKLIRLIAFNDRVAARASDRINALMNNALGSVGMLAGSIIGAIARVGIFLGLTALETVLGLLAAAVLGTLLVVVAIPVVLTAPIWTPIYFAVQAHKLKKEVAQLKAQITYGNNGTIPNNFKFDGRGSNGTTNIRRYPVYEPKKNDENTKVHYPEVKGDINNINNNSNIVVEEDPNHGN
jgi:hypothetical protein